MTMNNYIMVRLTHHSTAIVAAFIDANKIERRYRFISPASSERLQTVICRLVGRNEFCVRPPMFDSVGWVAIPK